MRDSVFINVYFIYPKRNDRSRENLLRPLRRRLRVCRRIQWNRVDIHFISRTLRKEEDREHFSRVRAKRTRNVWHRCQ